MKIVHICQRKYTLDILAYTKMLNAMPAITLMIIKIDNLFYENLDTHNSLRG